MFVYLGCLSFRRSNLLGRQSQHVLDIVSRRSLRQFFSFKIFWAFGQRIIILGSALYDWPAWWYRLPLETDNAIMRVCFAVHWLYDASYNYSIVLKATRRNVGWKEFRKYFYVVHVTTKTSVKRVCLSVSDLFCELHLRPNSLESGAHCAVSRIVFSRMCIRARGTVCRWMWTSANCRNYEVCICMCIT